jgi:hypothetical protein
MAGIAAFLTQEPLNRLGEKRKNAILWRLSPAGAEEEGLRFQYDPESYNDSKSVEYTPRSVPGSSLPIYQWVNSGERLISFNTLFTADVDTTNEEIRAGIEKDNLFARNAHIGSAIGFLRSCMMPTYQSDGVLAPPVLSLHIPGLPIGIWGGISSGMQQEDSIYCQMSQCELEIRARFLQSGAPRIVSVSLVFQQVPIVKGKIEFPSFTDVELGKMQYVQEISPKAEG